MSSRFPVYGPPQVNWSPNHQTALARVSPAVRDRVIRAASTQTQDTLDEPIYITPQTYNENARLAQLATAAPRIHWDEFISQHFRWLPGEHVGILGPTGLGKTNLIINLVPLHPFVVIFATKPKDASMEQFLHQGYLKMEYWTSLDADQYPKRVLWPDARKLGAVKNQQAVFHDAFEKIYMEGGWTVVIDELWYITNMLKLKMDIQLFLLQSRSLHVSLVMGTQRPAHVPLELYDMSTHLFFFRENDESNLKRISGIVKRSSSIIREIVSNLEIHQMLYVNTRTGEMIRTRAPKVTP